MEQLVTNLINTLSSVPAIVVYLIAAVYVGIECVGIGVPVEPVMLFLGSLAGASGGGKINAGLAILITGVACVFFGFISYTLGKRFGTEAIARYGKFIGLKPPRADHIELWLRRHGALGVTAIRSTPFVRSFCSFISGVADIPVPSFALGTFLGSAFYCGVWIVIGDLLGANYKVAFTYLGKFGPIGIAVVVAIVVVITALHWLAGRQAYRRLESHFKVHHHAEATPATVASPAASSAPTSAAKPGDARPGN
jgi:membrane protein DedA with SNARE-associated domain